MSKYALNMTDKICNINFEDGTPSPEFLIKSIAEQGYSLETALADLMDNSITANSTKIEVLTDLNSEPFTLFIADDGNGMDHVSLSKNMQFPSQSVEDIREKGDLGRFGLGLKTASFSQTRCFTVISRKKGTNNYSAMTWDVNSLKNNGWKIRVESQEFIKTNLDYYWKISRDHLNAFDNFQPNTIVIWSGLYKFENYIDVINKQDALRSEITNTTSEYLSIVFHRYMERVESPLKIRLNNILVSPFNPFPTHCSDLRVLEPSQKALGDDFLRIQGFILPNASIKQTKEENNIWTPINKSLMDMEGIYIYRADRLILFGGWNGLMKKMPRLQLARLKVDIGNKVDHLFHLNVAKSQIVIPFDLRYAFSRAVLTLKDEAQKEYYNHGIRTFTNTTKKESFRLYHKDYTNKGPVLFLNSEFPILKTLKESLNSDQLADLNFILKISTTFLNTIRQHDHVELVGNEGCDGISNEQIITTLLKLLKHGFSKEQIRKDVLPSLGISGNIAKEIQDLIK